MGYDANQDLEGAGGNQAGGIPLVTNGAPASPTKYTSNNTETQVNIDALMAAKHRGSIRVNPTELGWARFFDKSSSLTKTIKSEIDKHKGNSEQTDSKGQTIKERMGDSVLYLIGREGWSDVNEAESYEIVPGSGDRSKGRTISEKEYKDLHDQLSK